MEASSMASMIAILRKGHLKAVFQMFSFLKTEHNRVTVFDLAETDIDLTHFPTEDQSATHYGPYTKNAPSNAPVPRDIGSR